VALTASHPVTRAFGAHHGLRFPNYDHLSITVISFERIYYVECLSGLFNISDDRDASSSDNGNVISV